MNGQTRPASLDGLFYPSLVANLQILFDEGLTLAASPSSSESLASSGGDLGVARIPKPLFTTPGSNKFSFSLGVVPRQASIELPGYRQAGTFEMTLPFRDFPLDPRVVRAVGVAIHMDSVQAAEFAMGV